jgi:hypothetical protein
MAHILNFGVPEFCYLYRVWRQLKEIELMNVKPLAKKANTTSLPAVGEISLCRNQDKPMYSAHDSARVLTMGKASPETLSSN